MSLQCIRNFIFKSPQHALYEKDFFGTTMFFTICKIFDRVYKKYPLVDIAPGVCLLKC